jgi:DnaK suppressor protein
MAVRNMASTERTQVGLDTEEIRRSLQARYDELSMEYDKALVESHEVRMVEVTDTAGDDQADNGTKTAERDTAQSLLRTILDRRAQFERAMARLDEGAYGVCEGCGAQIPPERLEIFPSATSCVTCQESRERRAM